jgi:hypothetical protein
MEKECTKCLITQDIEQFAPHKNYKGERTTWCRACLNKQASNWSKDQAPRRRENDNARNKRKPEHKQNSKFKSRYGISLDEFNEMSTKQSDRCLICKLHKSLNKNSKLFVDHCHVSKKVRGLLCDNCNKGLGAFQDNPALLLKAVEYLKLNG